MWLNGEVLVPLDGSSVAENALPLAACVARALDRPVRLIHVVNEQEGVWTNADVERAREIFRNYGMEVAKRHGIEIDESRIDVDYGSPPARILEAARNAAAVVIATHGRGGFRSDIIGSVADKVIRGAEVPTFVAPGVSTPRAPGGATRPVLIALDGSDAAAAGLEYGRDFAEAIGAPRVLLQAYSLPPAVGVEFAYYPGNYAETLAEGARDYLAKVALPGEEQLVAFPKHRTRSLKRRASSTPRSWSWPRPARVSRSGSPSVAPPTASSTPSASRSLSFHRVRRSSRTRTRGTHGTTTTHREHNNEGPRSAQSFRPR